MPDYDATDKAKDPEKRGPGRPRKAPAEAVPEAASDKAAASETPEKKKRKPYPGAGPEDVALSKKLPALFAKLVHGGYSRALVFGTIDPGDPVIGFMGGPENAISEVTQLVFNASSRLCDHYLSDLKPGPLSDSAVVVGLCSGAVYLDLAAAGRRIEPWDGTAAIVADQAGWRPGDLIDLSGAPARILNLSLRARVLGLPHAVPQPPGP